MSPFVYTDVIDIEGAFRAELPTGIESTSSLLDAIGERLHFPDYYGRNWDALEECVRDLSWLPPGDILLVHHDLPLGASEAELSTYLSILCGAASKHATTGQRQLYVVFPPNTERRIRDL